MLWILKCETGTHKHKRKHKSFLVSGIRWQENVIRHLWFPRSELRLRNCHPYGYAYVTRFTHIFLLLMFMPMLMLMSKRELALNGTFCDAYSKPIAHLITCKLKNIYVSYLYMLINRSLSPKINYVSFLGPWCHLRKNICSRKFWDEW